jgi:anti-sigma regulatory factor (Ser/Thr protein kinase)
MGQLLAQGAEPGFRSASMNHLTFVLPRGTAMAVAKAIYVHEMEVRFSAVGALRHSVEAQLTRWGHDALRDAVALCTAELVTNVAKHAGSPMCVLTLESLGQEGVRLTVADRSSSLPMVRECDLTAESGRGMRLLAATASSFGYRLTDVGKDVWALFLCDREAAA